MDIAIVASFLAPFLPRLMELGGQVTGKVTEAISEKVGEAAWIKAQKIWKRLSPKLDENEDLKIAASQIVTKPNSTARQAVFKEELESLFDDNPELVKDIVKIMQEDTPDGTPGIQIVQNVTGDKNQTIGQIFDGKIIGSVEGNVAI